MHREKVKISEIIVENRQRQDLGDIDVLAESIRLYGLIQPIVINQEKKLIAGGRRLEACKRLSLVEVDITFRETLTQDELHELELEENVRRKDETWQERCLSIKTIHDLKKKRFALEGRSWGQRETGELFGIKSSSNVNYALRVANLLLATQPKDEEIWACESLSEAWRVIMRREEERILADLAASSKEGFDLSSTFNLAGPSALPMPLLFEEAASIASDESSSLISQPSAKDAASVEYVEAMQKLKTFGFKSLSVEEAKTLYLSSPTNVEEGFQSWYDERSQKTDPWLQIPLSRMLHFGDSISAMLKSPEAFDHIITDIPYGIDVEMMQQQMSQMQDISTIAAEHDVEENLHLYTKFFPAAFFALKPNSYLVTFCDMVHWRYMFDLAEAAGFKCQRWPLTWVKTHSCLNQSANVNFTKTTEVALVARKGVATLTQANIPCHCVCSHDELKEQLGHPFVKPFALWKWIIEAVSLEGQIVLEPFAGRGSGVISLLRLKRKVLACEVNEAHFNALVENVKRHYLEISPNFTFV